MAHHAHGAFCLITEGPLLIHNNLILLDSEHAIKFGDQIYIQCQHADTVTRFIEGQGMMSNGVAVVNAPVPCYDDCLFQVCVRARVSAAEELNKLQGELNDSEQEHANPDDQTRDLLHTLKRVKAKEEKMNKRAMEEKTGAQMVYGDVIQLLHCKTGKWLIVDEHQVATAEPENMLVRLSSDASMFSWFTVEPAAKFFFEGDTVCNFASVRFRSTPREQYLHLGQREFYEENLLKEQVLKQSSPDMIKLELNSSLTKHPWQILRYSTHLDSKSHLNCIQAGDLIYIEEPELGAYAALQQNRNSNNTGSPAANRSADTNSREGRQGVVFEPNALDGVFDVPSNALWVIEKQVSPTSNLPPIGGQILWNEGFYLRHLNTDKYLTTDDSGYCIASTSTDPAKADVYSMNPTIGVRSIYPRHGAALKFKRKRRADQESTPGSWLCFEDLRAIDLLRFDESEDLASTVVVRKIDDNSKRQQLMYALESRPILRQYSTNLQENDLATFTGSGELRSFTRTIQEVLAALATFVVEAAFRKKLREWNVATIPYRQRLLQQQGVLDIIIDLLQQLQLLQQSVTNGGMGIIATESARKMKNPAASQSPNSGRKDSAEDVSERFSWMSDLSEMCFTTLRVTIVRCQENQIHASERFEVLLSYVGTGRMAMACITEMMDNPVVQEEKIGDKEIKVFMDMLRKTTLNATILRVLQAICTCRGVAIRSNQTRLAKVVLTEHAAKVFVATKVKMKRLQLTLPVPGAIESSIGLVDNNRAGNSFFTTQLNLFASMCLSRNFECADVVRTMLPLDVLVEHIRDDNLSAELRSALCRVVIAAHVDCSPQVRMRLEQFSFSWSKLATEEVVNTNTLTTEPEIVLYKPLPDVSSNSSPVGSIIPGATSKSNQQKNTLVPMRGRSARADKLQRLLSCDPLHSNPILFDELQQKIVEHLEEIEDWSELTKELVDMLNTLIEFRFYHNHPDKLQKAVKAINRRLQKPVFGDVSIRPKKTGNERAPHMLGTKSMQSQRSMLVRHDAFGAPLAAVPGPAMTPPGGNGAQEQSLRLRSVISSNVFQSSRDLLGHGAKGNTVTPIGEYESVKKFTRAMPGTSLLAQMRSCTFTLPRRKHILKRIDSVPAMVVVLTLVILAIVVGFLQGDAKGWYYDAFEMLVYLAFLFELLLRFYAVGAVQLFTNPYSFMDFVVVALDTLLIAVKDLFGAAGGGTKSLRIIRVARLVRLLKVLRLVKAIHGMRKPPEYPVWKLPDKFQFSPKIQLQAMQLMVKVLVSANNINRRAQLCIFMKQIRHSFNEKTRLFDRQLIVFTPTSLQGKLAKMKKMSWAAKLMHSSLQVPLDLKPDAKVSKEHGTPRAWGGADLNSPRMGGCTPAHGEAPLHATLLHMVMYEYPELVQETLTTLMLHHDLHASLLVDVKEVQIIMVKEREEDFNQFERDLDHLSRTLETFFVDDSPTPKNAKGFGGDSDEPLQLQLPAGLANAQGPPSAGLGIVFYKTEPTLKRLIRHCKHVNESWLMGGDIYHANPEAQTMLRHLDAYHTLKLWRETYTRTREERFWERCNELFAAFCFRNPRNQQLGFSVVPAMMKNLHYDSSVLCDILQDNDMLIKLLPQNFVQVVVDSMFHQALEGQYDVACLVLLNNVAMYNDKPDNRHQLNIVLSMTTDPAVQEKLLFLCRNGKEYDKRTALIAKTHQNRRKVLERHQKSAGFAASGSASASVDGTEDEISLQFAEDMENALPNMLKYNVQLILLLCTCTAGSTERTNIIEARVQSLYPLKDLLRALLDPQTVVELKCALGKLFFDTYLDVEVPVQGFAQDESVWAYLSSMPAELEKSLVLLRQRKYWLRRTPIEKWQIRQQMEQTFSVVIPTINFFMQIYYKQIRMAHAFNDRDNLPAEFYQKVAEIHELCLVQGAINPTYCELGGRSSLYLLECYNVLRKFAGQTDGLAATVYNYSSQTLADMKDKHAAMQRRHSNADAGLAFKSFFEGDSDESGDPADVSTLSVSEQITNRIGDFKTEIEDFLNDPQVIELSEARLQTLVLYIQGLPRQADTTKDAALRYEPLLAKLVNHTRSNITFQNGQKFVAPEYQETTSWLLDLFRTMVEHEWGFSVLERDELGTEDSDGNAADIQLSLQHAGAVALCIELIATGIPDGIKDKAMLLLITLLFREGGHRRIQETANKELQRPQNKLFFDTVNDIIGNFASFHEQAGDSSDDMPAQIRIILCLRLMCEGHFRPNQDILREQPQTNNSASVNVLETVVSAFINVGGAHRNPSAMCTTIALANLILEVTQGPCPKNQSHLAIGTELLEAMNGMLRVEADTETTNIQPEQQEELKQIILKIFMALLEKQKDPSDVFDRILSVVHVEVLQLLVHPRESSIVGSDDMDAIEKYEEKEAAKRRPLTAVQAQSLVLIQILRDYNPSLSEELHLGQETEEKLKTELCSVEVVWDGPLRRRFFKVPTIMAHLVAATKEQLVAEVDRSCQELKYQDFLKKSRLIHSELQHMDMLRRMQLLPFFNRTIQDRMTWVTFGVNLVINMIYIIRMRAVHVPGAEVADGEDTMGEEGVRMWTLDSSKYDMFLVFCNVCQIMMASFTLLLYSIVRAPVMYKYKFKDTRSVFSSIMHVASPDDSLLPYYVMYVAFAVLGYALKGMGPLFNTFLLFDIIVKNSTSRDVLKAVWQPARQLGATLSLMLMTVYVFSMFLFMYAPHHFPNQECETVFSCVVVTFGFGLRMGGGIGEYLDFDENALGYRYIIDFLYYALVLIILLNIVFGIIIDTFSDLREKKKEKLEDTKGKCFMCGIDKATFDRGGSQVFLNHIKEEHNMWSYLKFVVAIWEQDEDDDDGLESYVRKCIEERDHEWLPSAKCIRLPNHKEGDDAHGSTQHAILDQMSALDQKVNVMMQALKDLAESANAKR